jgi:adenosylhomocysteine nucleosidase
VNGARPDAAEITGIVTGLRLEAAAYQRALRSSNKPAPQIVCGGACATGARRAVEKLLAAGVTALMSFGLAGGLDPTCRPGDIILADQVVPPTGQGLASDAGWIERVYARAKESGLNVRTAGLAGSDRPLISALEKLALFANSTAAAVDMESHIAAQAARSAGIPFLVLRVIADPAERSLPAAALSGLDDKGEIHPGAMLGSLLRQPTQLPGLVALSVDAARARAGLRRAADLRADLLVRI